MIEDLCWLLHTLVDMHICLCCSRRCDVSMIHPVQVRVPIQGNYCFALEDLWCILIMSQSKLAHLRVVKLRTLVTGDAAGMEVFEWNDGLFSTRY